MCFPVDYTIITESETLQNPVLSFPQTPTALHRLFPEDWTDASLHLKAFSWLIICELRVGADDSSGPVETFTLFEPVRNPLPSAEPLAPTGSNTIVMEIGLLLSCVCICKGLLQWAETQKHNYNTVFAPAYFYPIYLVRLYHKTSPVLFPASWAESTVCAPGRKHPTLQTEGVGPSDLGFVIQLMGWSTPFRALLCHYMKQHICTCRKNEVQPSSKGNVKQKTI